MQRYPQIGDHAAVGDARSVALVTRAGTIDWLCWPHFDSPAVFASLLDPERGGSWTIAPVGPATVTRRYLPDTNVLETRSGAEGGTLVVLDAMTVTTEQDKRREPLPEHELVRIARCESGTVDVAITYEPRPNFGLARFTLRGGPLGIRLQHGSELFTLRCDRPLAVADGRATGRFTLCAGEAIACSLGYDAREPTLLLPLGGHAMARLERTAAWWRAWISNLTYRGRYRDAVARSLLAVKLLQFAPSGAIVAAPTTSLPERIGEWHNWDYRYCWLRDASMTAYAALATGFPDEAEAFTSWLLHTTRLTRPELRILYDVYGNLPHHEQELPLAGYLDSRPVRVRNAAAAQLQLDCYGEVIDAVEQIVVTERLDRETARMLADFGRYVCSHWRMPDQSIWEPRTPPRHYTLSKAMCWVALDRLITLGAPQFPLELFRATRDEIRAEIPQRGYDAGLASYTAAYDDPRADASLLLLAWYGFEAGSSPRMQGTWRRIQERLGAGAGLLYRDEHHRGNEGAFLICSFWAADFLARGGGSLAEARAMFERAIGYANDVGLLGEEVDPATGDALGNFPQAYSHVGLIGAALALDERAAAEQEAA